MVSVYTLVSRIQGVFKVSHDYIYQQSGSNRASSGQRPFEIDDNFAIILSVLSELAN